jgi:maltose phosphorylase
MAGTWMSIVEGFVECELRTTAYIFFQNPKRMDGYSFKINFRNQILKVIVNQQTKFTLEGSKPDGICKQCGAY